MSKKNVVCTALLFLFLFPVLSYGEKKLSLNLISGPFATGSYALSTALETISKTSDMGIEINHTETPGLVYNRRKMEKDPDLKKNTIHSYTKGINWLAMEGKPPFKKKYSSVKAIANYNLGSVWLASFNEKLQTIESLKGKSIAIGRGTQILWAIEPMWIIDKQLNMKKDLDIQFVGTKPAMTALLDGVVDAAIVGGYINPEGKIVASPQTMELIAAGKKLYNISWGKEAIQGVIDKGYPIAAISVPAGAIEGLDTPIDSFCDPIAWVGYPELSEETAYKVTKMIIDNVTKFIDYHALGQLMTPKSLVYGWPEDMIHPGALKAYKEAGIL
jgi:TRAP transporter TAXI family solute receptor